MGCILEDNFELILTNTFEILEQIFQFINDLYNQCKKKYQFPSQFELSNFEHEINKASSTMHEMEKPRLKSTNPLVLTILILSHHMCNGMTIATVLFHTTVVNSV